MPCSIYLSATHKSSGKTIVSLGISAALKKQSMIVQPFKKGPDYIDPIWLTHASGNACYNLDFYTMSTGEIKSLYARHASSSDVCIIEGNKGLFDGVSTTGGDANADLAKLLNVAVVLVIDTSGMTRGIAPLLLGYQAFDKGVHIAGIILNKVAGKRHESKLIRAVEHYTDITVLGSIRQSKELIIDERHLGLMPANESSKSEKTIKRITQHIIDQVDLRQIVQINQKTIKPPATDVLTVHKTITVAIAKDSAFGFYYQDDIDAFKSLGVEIVYFNTLTDAVLPKADGLFIGGGFPEMRAAQLSNNQSLLADIKNKIEDGLPTYAECGGLMYLSRKIIYQHKSYPMMNVLKADVVMLDKPVGRGYVELTPTEHHPWQGVAQSVYAHEFHYSRLENINFEPQYAFKVLRGVGVNNTHDGIILYNLLACYGHLRNVAGNAWVQQFVAFIKNTTI